MGLEVGGVRALRPCGAAFVKKKRTFLGVLYGSPDTRAQERGEDGGGGDAQRRMGRARALGGQAGGTAACAARRVRARRGIWWHGTQRTTGRSGQRRRAGRVSRRPFDAAPPGLNRGAGLVPGTQVAGRRRRLPGGGGGGQLRAATAGHRGRVGLAYLESSGPSLGWAYEPNRGSSFRNAQVPGVQHQERIHLAHIAIYRRWLLRGAKGHVSCDERRLSRTGER